MDFEKQIRQALKTEAEKASGTEGMKEKVMNNIFLKKGRTRMKKRLLAGIMATAILIPTAGFAGYSYLSDRIFGSQDNFISQGGSRAEYAHIEEKLTQAKRALNEKEYAELEQLLKEIARYHAKMAEPGGKLNVDRLTKEEKQRYNQLEKEMEPYAAKITVKEDNPVDILTIEESQKLLSFPVHHPSYVPEGYTLGSAVGVMDANAKKSKPVINMYYEHGDAGIGIFQQEIGAGEQVGMPDEYERIQKYKLESYEVTFGQGGSDKEDGLSLVVPAQGGKSAYRIYIAGKFPQAELEKIALSIVHQ
ncbi:DUF3600 domain-containing protein [Aneurinibacillus aneurinilyticus]|uniref:DUF3600 domain-containing protein n=1 Tax=Aneurinibacillus aneurinilyticus TaxID=1391 RepID=A0A848CUY5_ANEAE|nr:DUF3600 domain-containing protein [Aneurinibacillus aneurinilyticus]NME98771.1 DUF3600 domain-containing protein [Aneurinibacillus aneurinilyticus]